MNSSGLSSDQRTIIIGGGVIGVCTAYYLAKRGARVTVLERDEIGKGASFGNAGCIAPGHAPINKPGRIKQAIKSLFDPLSPLYIAPRPDPELARWLWTFSRTCTEEHVERSMERLASLGHATRQLFSEILQQEKLDCCFRDAGYYEVYRTEKGLAGGRKEAALTARYGFHPEILNGEQLREREPAMRLGVIGGIFFPEAATLNPYKFVAGLARRCREMGVIFVTSTEVAALHNAGGRIQGVRLKDGTTLEADAVVLAAGAYSASLLRELGIYFPLQGGKGYHRDCAPAGNNPPLMRQACVLGENMVFCTPMDGFVRLAGTLEFSGLNHEIRRPRLEQLTLAAARYITGTDKVVSQSEWCGLRPCLPDGMPAIGPVRRCPGLFVGTGHAMLGLTMGPVTGKLLAECILDGAPTLNLEGMSPERFRSQL